MNDEITLLFDIEQKRPGCAILQALAGCSSQDLWDVGFDSKDWILSPTPSMRKITGTKEEWGEMARRLQKEREGNLKISLLGKP